MTAYYPCLPLLIGETLTMNLVADKHANRQIVTVLLAIVFAVAYGQDLLYDSNQHTYFLHGLADAGLGFVSDDWMANTVDPFVAFSWLVSVSYQYLPAWFFYLFYALILGLFSYSIIGIAAVVSGTDVLSRQNRQQTGCCFLLVCFICSGFLQWLSLNTIGSDIGKVFYSGVAGQYILGKVFQPSTFGVFLIISVYAFLRQRAFWAVLFLAIAATFHPSYLISAAALTLSYMVLTLLPFSSQSNTSQSNTSQSNTSQSNTSQSNTSQKLRKSLLIGLFSLMLVAPIVIYSLVAFAPTSAEMLHQSQSILIDQRIPHHAKPNVWFDASTVVKLMVVLLALWVVRKQQLLLILLIPFVVGLGLTLVQIFIDSAFLALLFPWRISAFLLPLASFVLVAGGVSLAFKWFGSWVSQYHKVIDVVLVAGIGGLLVSGLWIQSGKVPLDSQLESHIAATRMATDLYLIPVKLKRLRLQGGVRVFVDYKTHPYKDNEVIAWYKRLQRANQFYAADNAKQCGALQHMSVEYGITHMVNFRRKGLLHCPSLEISFDDGEFVVYRLVP